MKRIAAYLDNASAASFPVITLHPISTDVTR